MVYLFTSRDILEIVISWARGLTSNSSEDEVDEAKPPPEKLVKTQITGRAEYLLYQQKKHPQQQSTSTSSTSSAIREEMRRYLMYDHNIEMNEAGNIVELDPIKFWSQSIITRDMPSLAKLARLVLSVPASSAAVERDRKSVV